MVWFMGDGEVAVSQEAQVRILNSELMLGIVAHAFNPSIWEVEEGGPGGQGQPRLHETRVGLGREGGREEGRGRERERTDLLGQVT